MLWMLPNEDAGRTNLTIFMARFDRSCDVAADMHLNTGESNLNGHQELPGEPVRAVSGGSAGHATADHRRPVHRPQRRAAPDLRTFVESGRVPTQPLRLPRPTLAEAKAPADRGLRGRPGGPRQGVDPTETSTEAPIRGRRPPRDQHPLHHARHALHALHRALFNVL